MTFLYKVKYHIYTFAGFLLYILCTLTAVKVYIKVNMETQYLDKVYQDVSYYIAEALVCSFLAYMLSIPLLWVVEKNSDFSRYRTAMGGKVVLTFIAVQVAYTYMLWPALSEVHRLIMHTKMDIPTYVKILNMSYFAAMFLIWLFTIITIKLVQHLKQVRIKQLQLENNLRDSQLNTLKGQINPHFMFNSLNNIRGLILEDTTRARDSITRLSEMLRYSLTKNDTNTILLKEELQTVDNYIEISKIQFEDRLQFSMDVDTNVLNIAIPPMVIQMLVENAVKHGIGKLKEGGIVKLCVKKGTDNILRIGVLNSGRLNMAEGGTRLGLENIKKRLFLIFGDKASFTLEEKNGLVEAYIAIPLNKTEE
ncbi:sensor histidine kinase [Flavobacterium sp. RHBU_3]|uniref:sensor histidine kinase n=1 Tax=Flavobacterium sp. RHBU_3 TaxID=3391184 RepID=UPI003984D94A